MLRWLTCSVTLLLTLCPSPPRSSPARSLWETMLVAKQKEAVMEVRGRLVEAASKENLPIKMSMGESPVEKHFMSHCCP